MTVPHGIINAAYEEWKFKTKSCFLGFNQLCPRLSYHGIINAAYEWEIQDQILLSWLQSTLSKAILSPVLRVVHSYQVWEQIHDHFCTQTKAQTR